MLKKEGIDRRMDGRTDRCMDGRTGLLNSTEHIFLKLSDFYF
jgi:hypothetical protein